MTYCRNNNIIKISCKRLQLNIILLVFIISSHFVLCDVASEREITSNTNLGNDTNPVITITQGQLQGLERRTTKGKTFYSFKAIPYAEPPINNLRFKDPVPAKSWNGVRDATKDGNYCPQNNLVMGDLIGEEDCLFLNVYTPELPANNENKKYPVLVNIHSGGFTMGSGVEDEFNPEVFVENDIVVVSINYRLGIFGFLSLDTPEVPGNAALKDQRLSLLWVRDNIHYFNGDKNDVTLLGISAGSTSVEYHLLHPESKGLFHKASMQSGTALSSFARPSNPTLAIEKLTDHLGILNDPYDILDHLNSLSTMEVLDAASKSGNDKELHRLGYVFTQFVPVIEKTFPNVESFITKDPLELYQSGSFIKVPTLRTFCRDEGTVFQFMYGDLIDEISNGDYADFMSFLNVTDKAEVNEKLSSLYKAMNVSKMDETHEFLSDLMFLSGIYQSLKYITKDEGLKHYTYMFSYVSNKTQDDVGNALGKVPHTIDMSYLIYTETGPISEEDLKIRQIMSTIFVNFVKHGDPTADGKIQWTPSKKENDYSVLNIQGDNNKVIPFPFAERMKYWDTLYH